MTTETTITPELLDQLLANYEKPEDLTGADGLFKQLKKALIERALGAELSDHLGYEKGDPAGRDSGNSRNGTSAKTILTEDGEIDIAVPRDRAGSFEPLLIAKGQTRFDGFDDKILSLYARGMTVREIQGHLSELYGAEVSPDLISRVTDAVLDEVREWQTRPLDPVYPVVFFDALRVKIRDEGMVKNKAVYVALALNPDGEKEVLGLWIEQTEGAKFWLKVINDLKTRGVNDILIAVVDGLKGFPERLGLSADGGADLHRAPDPQQPGVCRLEGSQGDPACHQGNLPGRECRHGAGPARGVRGRMGQALSGDRPGLAPRLGTRRAVLRVRSWRPQDDLYHQRGRGAAP
jgi:transposase-like protein